SSRSRSGHRLQMTPIRPIPAARRQVTTREISACHPPSDSFPTHAANPRTLSQEQLGLKSDHAMQFAEVKPPRSSRPTWGRTHSSVPPSEARPKLLGGAAVHRCDHGPVDSSQEASSQEWQSAFNVRTLVLRSPRSRLPRRIRSHQYKLSRPCVSQLLPSLLLNGCRVGLQRSNLINVLIVFLLQAFN